MQPRAGPLRSVTSQTREEGVGAGGAGVGGGEGEEQGEWAGEGEGEEEGGGASVGVAGGEEEASLNFCKWSSEWQLSEGQMGLWEGELQQQRQQPTEVLMLSISLRMEIYFQGKEGSKLLLGVCNPGERLLINLIWNLHLERAERAF